MIPVQLVLALAQFARIGSWVMTLFLAGAALAILAFGAGAYHVPGSEDFPGAPDRLDAGLTVLGLAVVVTIVAAALGPVARRLAELRGRV